MTRKKVILAIVLTVLYCLLLVLLVTAESAYTPAPGESVISTFPEALWYSLTTLTTVGYGDMYPHTVAGKIIGSVFLVLSVGFLVFLISALWSRIKDRILPKMKLYFARDKEWFIFSDYNPQAAALCGNLKKGSKNRLFIFPEQERPDGELAGSGVLCTCFSIEDTVKMKKGRGTVSVFYTGADEYENYRRALATDSARVYCMAEYEPDRITDRITFFHPYRCCARMYWRRFPICSEAETVALIGGGKYAAAVLEQALLLNVYSPRQHMTYLIYGDPAEFTRDHPYLSQAFSIDEDDPERDSLFFLPADWRKDADRLSGADRIIVCYDSEGETLDTLCRLSRCFPVSGTVYARISEPFENIVTFGGSDEIFTPELVMHTDLDKAAKALHEIYRGNAGNTPPWNELSDFLRRSNMASADHMEVKAQILLGRNDSESPNERYMRAYGAYIERRDRDAELFRETEHLRWMRFHILNNWRYAPARDNARRLHPLLIPYDRLSPADRKKNDDAWELLKALSGSEL